MNGVEQLSRNIRRAADGIKDFQGFFENALDIIAARSDSLFAAQGSNVQKGPAWPPLSEKTLKARKNRWGYYKRSPSRPGILRWTGNLQEKRDRHVSPMKGSLTFAMPYSGYHQDGSGKLPKRVIVDLSNPTNVEIVRALQAHMHKAVGTFGKQR